MPAVQQQTQQVEETVNKRTHIFLALMIAGLVLGLVPAKVPQATVQAQAGPQAEYQYYFPLIGMSQHERVEQFRMDPNWPMNLLKDPKDGYFEHSDETQSLWGHVTDNSALMVTWPGWRTYGDYKIEVDARHVGPLHKSFNGLGLVFNATDEFKHFYALMLAMGAAQNFWSLVRFENTRAFYETNDGYRGGPGFMKDWDGWNELEVRVIDGEINVYCNNKWLPGGMADGTKYLVEGRLVGLVATSYEFDNAIVEYDNLRLTPLKPGDPDYEEVIQMREARAALGALEFDTPALDLHR
jgi:hypothetical protein